LGEVGEGGFAECGEGIGGFGEFKGGDADEGGEEPGEHGVSGMTKLE
jgi:hypothetical protein